MTLRLTTRCFALPRPLLAQVYREARRTGMSRSAKVAQLLLEALERRRKLGM